MDTNLWVDFTVQEPESLRFETAAGRENAVLFALMEEYIFCFRTIDNTSKHRRAVLKSMNTSIELAFSTIVPLLFCNAFESIDNLHPVMRVICTVYFRHLRVSWFALENDRLDTLYSKLTGFSLE